MQENINYDIIEEQTGQLFNRVPLAVLMNVIISTILVIIQWPLINHYILLGWWFAGGFIALSRLVLARFYHKRKPKLSEIKIWQLRLMIIIFCSGLAWGAASILLFPENNPVHQHFLAYALAGMATGGVTTLSSKMSFVVIFLSTILFPIMIRFLLLGEYINLIMGLMFFLLYLVLIVNAKKNNTVIIKSMKLNIKNEQKELQLQEAQNRYISLIESVPIGIFRSTLNKKQSFLMANSSMIEMFNYYKPESIYQASIYNLFAHQAEAELFIDKLMTEGGLVAAELKLVKRTAEVIWGAVTVNVNWNESGEIIIDAMIENITERKKAEDELLKAKKTADNVNRIKSEFLNNISHELRTPMNVIIGMTDMIINTQLSEEQQEYLNMLKESADSLLTLLDTIINFSKLVTGSFELNIFGFPLRFTLNNNLKIFIEKAALKSLNLTYKIAPDIPDILIGDSKQLTQVIGYLLDNAIKFTNQGEIQFHVDKEPDEDDLSSRDELQLHFTVIDTGIGIPQEKQRMIFESFTQVDGSINRVYNGTGLGLAISKHLIEMMDGEIWLENQVEKGSIFHFTARFRLH